MAPESALSSAQCATVAAAHSAAKDALAVLASSIVNLQVEEAALAEQSPPQLAKS